MSGAYVNSAKGNQANGTTVAATLNGVTAGNTLIVLFVVNNGFNRATTSPVTSSPAETWTERIHSTLNDDISIYEASNVAGGNYTITCHEQGATNNTMGCDVHEVSGLVLAGAFDKSAAGSGTSVTPSSGNTATLTQADEYVFGGAGRLTGTGSWTAGSGYNLRQNATDPTNGSAQASEDKSVLATTAVSATFTIASAAWECVCATFKSAAAATESYPAPYQPMPHPAYRM